MQREKEQQWLKCGTWQKVWERRKYIRENGNDVGDHGDYDDRVLDDLIVSVRREMRRFDDQAASYDCGGRDAKVRTWPR